MGDDSTSEGPVSGTSASFVPALRYRALTPAYDTVIRWTTRERIVKGALLEAAELGRAARLLDIGCGTGTFVISAKRQHPRLDVIGMDRDREILERARLKANREGVHVTFVEGSATELPAPDGAFDRVTSSLVFHHLGPEQKQQAASEIDRVLSSDGEFHLADWVQPSNALMRTLFWSVQILDGFDTTRDHVSGRFVERLRAGGLIDVSQHRTISTLAGTVGLISARAAGHGRSRLATEAI